MIPGHGFTDESQDMQKKQAVQIGEYKQQQVLGIKKQQESFLLFVSKSKAEYDRWNLQHNKELDEFKNQVRRAWGSYTSPTNKIWVEYARDKRSVAKVDFVKGTATVAVLVGTGASAEQIQQKVTEAVDRAVSSKGSSQSIPCAAEQSEQLLPAPVLDRQVFNFQGEPVTVDRVSRFAQELMHDAVYTPVVVSLGNEKQEYTKVEVSFSLVPDNLLRRISRFMPFITKYCTRYNLNPAHVLATIHTESLFNPMAVSEAHAIGLMQLVPAYGGREAYRFVYGDDAVPQDRYLLDPEHNIELGCAYMYLLKNRYFSSVNDSLSLRHCIIAAYNTGPGNVWFVFDRNRSAGKAVAVVNSMSSSSEVFERLVGALPYLETRVYLADVTGKMNLYR